MPISMYMSIRKVNPVSSDSPADLSREGVKVKRGRAGNTNFRRSNAIFDIPDLRRESNILKRVKESRREPIAGTNKEFSFEVLEEDVNLVVARSQLPNIGEQGQNENVGGKDVIEESRTKVFATLNCVSVFFIVLSTWELEEPGPS